MVIFSLSEAGLTTLFRVLFPVLLLFSWSAFLLYEVLFLKVRSCATLISWVLFPYVKCTMSAKDLVLRLDNHAIDSIKYVKGSHLTR